MFYAYAGVGAQCGAFVHDHGRVRMYARMLAYSRSHACVFAAAFTLACMRVRMQAYTQGNGENADRLAHAAEMDRDRRRVEPNLVHRDVHGQI